jgi:hypothetical protein
LKTYSTAAIFPIFAILVLLSQAYKPISNPIRTILGIEQKFCSVYDNNLGVVGSFQVRKQVVMQVNDSTRGIGIKNQPLSERQRAILRFVQDYIQQHKHPPSTREIGQGVGISSTSNVIYHVKRLVDYGYLGRQPGTSRTVIVLATDYEQTDEPLVRDWAAELAALRAENRRLLAWCRQLERERAYEREQREAARAG